MNDSDLDNDSLGSGVISPPRTNEESAIREAWWQLLGRLPSEDEIASELGLGSAGAATRSRRLALSEEGLARVRHFRFLNGEVYDTVLSGNRLAFVHIEKCGGTTLHEMLTSQFPANRICPERFDGLGSWTINELSRFDLFSGHFDVAYCRSIPGRVRLITMLRDPRERLLSVYRFWRAHKPSPEVDSHPLIPLTRTMSAEEFFSDPLVDRSAGIRDAIVGQLIREGEKGEVGADHILRTDPGQALKKAWKTLKGMAAFGFVERMEDTRLVLNDALGLQMPRVAPKQVLTDLVTNRESFVVREEEPVTAGLMARLDALTAVDRALYDKARRLFDTRVRMMRLKRLATGGAGNGGG